MYIILYYISAWKIFAKKICNKMSDTPHCNNNDYTNEQICKELNKWIH